MSKSKNAQRKRYWSCTRKMRYTSAAEANAVAVAMNIRVVDDRPYWMTGLRGGSVEHYKCAYCGGWHVGHATNQQQAEVLGRDPEDSISGDAS